MKYLIAFMSRHGCAEKCATRLQELLAGETQLVNFRENKHPDIRAYDVIIIGDFIHTGQVQKEVQNFGRNHLSDLAGKKVALFLCCMEEGEKAQEQFRNAFPEELRNQAVVNGNFGGSSIFKR